MRVLTKASFIVVMLFSLMLTPVAASADTISVTQVITITATVLPARSIVVNDAGRIMTIYSNTDEPVTPKVFLNKTHARELPLTPELKTQYDQIIADQKNMVGVKIPVAEAQPTKESTKQRLSFASFINKLQATTGLRPPLL